MNLAPIPVARPLLPKAAQLAPYLDRIDGARWYSNNGPLAQELEARLAWHFGAEEGCVALAANATLALAAAIRVTAVGAGSYCLAPAWTFAAAGHAIRAAGLKPFLVDCDPETGVLDFEQAAAILRARPGEIAAVMVVAPFGAPAPLAAIDAFMDAHGLPVILDAAAGFDACRPSRALTVVSLHATKALGAGEGGFALTGDPATADALRRYVNFGFDHARRATGPGLNGKMSEYAAAVAHAALDDWRVAREDWLRVAAAYGARLGGAPGLRWPAGLGTAWVTASPVIRMADGAGAIDRLAHAGVETRAWWGGGLHRHPAFAGAPGTPLTITDRLAAESLGLPCYRDMEDGQIAAVCEALRAVGQG